MAVSKRPIFRSQALQAYAQQRQKSVLPRFVAPPVFLLCWVLLALLASATIVAWLTRVPTYLSVSGIVLAESVPNQQGNSEAVAALFVPASSVTPVRVGQAAQVQIGSTGPQLTGTISTVDAAILSPAEVRQRFGLSGSLAQIVTQPSLVVMIRLGPTISAQTYAGSLVQSQIQIGTRSILSLLPILNHLIGD